MEGSRIGVRVVAILRGIQGDGVWLVLDRRDQESDVLGTHNHFIFEQQPGDARRARIHGQRTLSGMVD